MISKCLSLPIKCLIFQSYIVETILNDVVIAIEIPPISIEKNEDGNRIAKDPDYNDWHSVIDDLLDVFL